MTQMSQPLRPNVFRSKAIFSPSGDQEGYSPETRLSRCWWEPAALITQIRGNPLPWAEAKAILRPFGDHAGA